MVLGCVVAVDTAAPGWVTGKPVLEAVAVALPAVVLVAVALYAAFT